MSKELSPLEALEKIIQYNDLKNPVRGQTELIDIIEKALKEHNRVLVANIKLGSENNVLHTTIDKLNEWLAKYEIVSKIIKEKGVNVYIFLLCASLEDYKKTVENFDWRKLTQEEYDFLKEVLL